MRIDKLVRDKVHDVVEASGGMDGIHFQYIVGEELARYHKAKVLEEIAEYMVHEDVVELVDVLEAIFAMANNNHGASMTYLLKLCEQKRIERGSFNLGIVMRGTVK